MKLRTIFTVILSSTPLSSAFLPISISRVFHATCLSNDAKGGDWNGEVASNTNDGTIRGCTLTQVEGSMTDWIISIDGQEADLGKFSEAIYRKISSDAKQQRFQGFRPGTIPPHLISTYIQSMSVPVKLL